MSADSRAKRSSALNIIPILVVYPNADSEVDNFDRMQATWLYAGISAGAPAVPEPEPEEEVTTSLGGGGGGGGIRKRTKSYVGEMIVEAHRIEEEEIFLILM